MNLDTCKEGQRLTITTFDRPLMVAAGAGSGKTFTLTRRIAYGLLAGEEAPGGLQSIDEVLAITFTVKAAAELRDPHPRSSARGGACGGIAEGG